MFWGKSSFFLRRGFSEITEVPANLRLFPKDKNQVRMLAKYAKDFMAGGKPAPEVEERTKLFHLDSVICGVSAIAFGTNAPLVLRKDALRVTRYVAPGDDKTRPKSGYAKIFGSDKYVLAEKAILANSAAVREYDSNGTNFGYNTLFPSLRAGEFGHNDFYPVVMAACQQKARLTGKEALRAMILLDEIRGRLSESFSLKTYKIDHVVHGGIASAITYGTLMGATIDQIESAVGMLVAHHIPYRAIRAGKQLSDSKGASAAITTEAAIVCLRRSMDGFVGPKDIFRNPEAVFRLNEKTKGSSPFNIVCGFEGTDFSVMGMHFKLGLYEHQSAGAIQSIMKLIQEGKTLADLTKIKNIKILAYEPAYGIIGDPAKKNPTTRQSADHSMCYIISTIIRKYITDPELSTLSFNSIEEVWKRYMLAPIDYGYEALYNKDTREIMELITFEHGGPEYDQRYPEGIPTSISIEYKGKTDLNPFKTFKDNHFTFENRRFKS